MKSDEFYYFMSEKCFYHICDCCEQLLDGEPFAYWEEKNFTICYACLIKTTESFSISHGETDSKEDYLNNRYSKQPIPNELRWAIWERDNFTCQYCMERKNLTIDHIDPESHGGLMTKDNLVTCCKSCNSKKGARTPTEAGMQLLNDPRE